MNIAQDKVNFNTPLTVYARKRLEFHAARLGFITDRGARKGQPSISQLLEAIADGSVRLVKEIPTPDKKGLHP